MTFEEIVSRFRVDSRSGSSCQCFCPAHDDSKASLTISRGEKGTVLHCHADCDTETILSRVGLTMADLFDQPLQESGKRWRRYVEKREKRQIEGVYNYVDLSGKYAFSRIRLSGKKFLYGILDGERFNYGLGGRKRNAIPAIYCNGLERLRKAVEAGERIFYVEGEKDVNTLSSKGFSAVTCGAAGDWVPGCATLFQGADVVILADNDEPGRKLARNVEKDLRDVAKSVRIVTPTPEIEHGDISDFFADHTIEDLEELLRTQDQPGDGFSLDRFHLFNESTGKISGVFDYEIFRYITETQDLFILGGTPYIYREGAFRPDFSGAELKTLIRELIYPEFIKSNTIKRIYDLFVSAAELQVRSEDLNAYPPEWICFRNGFYDPIGKRMIPHDPKYRAINQIPYEFDPEAELTGEAVSEWLKFIVNDPDDLEMLLQFSGLCMTRDTRQQKFLILNGTGGSGKSTVIRMIESVIGAENTSNISLNQLTQRFSAFGLMGKLLNSCADLEVSALEDTSTLKKVLGEDTLSAEAKGKDAISFKSYAKLIFSTNELPIVKAERTNGFYRRLLILNMNNVPDRRRADFFDQLSGEIEYFIQLSVKALERLYQAGTIIESSGSIEAVKRLRCDSDTVEAFLSDRAERSPDARIKKGDLFREYERYCIDMERQSLTKNNFYRSMKTKGFPEVKSSGVEFFKGIKLQENLPKSSLSFSLSGWKEVTGEPIPFD